MRAPGFLAAALLVSQVQTAPSRPEWDDTSVLHRGTEAPHATMMVYPSAELARRAEPADSPWFVSLNGTWKFRASPRPDARPADFFRPDADVAGWHDIRVPASIETQGEGMPIYVNAGYAFPFNRQDPHPPHDDNPVGSYRRTFTVPDTWNGRRVLLHFNGVDSAFYAWVNGEQVGYSEDSRTPAEFDVTRLVHPGRQHARRRGLPLERRLVPRRSGHVASERHLPRRVSVESGGRPRPRFRDPRGPGRCVSGRDAEDAREDRQPGRRGGVGRSDGGSAGRRRTARRDRRRGRTGSRRAATCRSSSRCPSARR